jgi:hypothetical protein
MPLAAAPLKYERAGKIEGCGVRVTGGSAAPKTRSVWFDLSFNVYARGTAAVQAIAYTMAPSRYEQEARPERSSIQRAWVQPRGATGSTRLGENTEARDALAYAITFDEGLRLFEAVAMAQPVVVGLRAWGEPREWRFEGIAELSDAGRAEVAKCVGALVN